MGKFITYDETKGRRNRAGGFKFHIKFLGLEATANTAFGILSLDLEANKQQQEWNVKNNKKTQEKAKPTYTTKKNQTAEGKSLSLEKRMKPQKVGINHLV